MKTYFYYTYLSFKAQLMYRVNIIFSLLRAFLFLLIQIALWKALYAGKSGSMAGYSLDDMLTYQILSTIISCFLNEMTPMTVVQDDVNTGNMVNYLKLPCSYQGQVFMTSLGKNIFSFLFVSIPMLLLSPLFARISAPVSMNAFGISVLAVLLSVGIYFEIYSMFGMISFWFMDRYHTIGLLLTNVIRILSGAIIPLAFFPKWLLNIVLFLPMRYGFDFPLSIYLGKAGQQEIIQGFIVQAVWIIALGGMNRVLFHTGLKKLILQGG